MIVSPSGARSADMETFEQADRASALPDGRVVFDTIEPSGTPAFLTRLIAALTLATALAGGASLAVFVGAHGAVDGIGLHAAPAVFEVEAARAALADADWLAVTTLSSGTGPGLLAGPGSQYHDDLAVASQSLDQLAADNVAGSDGRQLLQTIEGLQATYTALVEQADAGYHQQNVPGQGLANLWYASELMNSDTGGGSILADLDMLRQKEQSALDTQWSSFGNSPAPVAAAMTADLAIFGVLAATQITVHRRFRRTLNIRLLAASVLVLLIAGITGSALISRQELANIRQSTYTDVINAYGQEINTLRTQSEPILAEKVCAVISGSSACPSTLEPAIQTYEKQMTADPTLVSTPHNDAILTQTIAGGRQHFATAAAGADADFSWLRWAAVGALAAALILITWGLWSRLAEYQYQAR